MDTATAVLRLLLLVGILVQSGSALKCYVCNSDTNDDCSRKEDERDCDKASTPTTKYDTCQTTIKRTPEMGISIIKKCAVGPCALGPAQNTALMLNCDRSVPTWDCEVCCNSDLCNVNAAPGSSTLQPRHGILLAAILATIFSAILADVTLPVL